MKFIVQLGNQIRVFEAPWWLALRTIQNQLLVYLFIAMTSETLGKYSCSLAD